MINRNKRTFTFLIGCFIIIGLIAVACSQEPETVEVTRIVEVEVPVEVAGPQVEVTRIVEVAPETAVSVIPFEAEWANSPHNDVNAEAFIHWDEDDPAEVPASCAKCHSTLGYLDFLGADGSEAGMVNSAHPVGTTVQCEACHNDVTREKTSVVFPSGIEVTGLGPEARCMECHQGRASTNTVNNAIEQAGLDPAADLDTVSEDLGFSNIHYYAAAATQFGTTVMGGYQYDGKSYDAKFEHVAGYDTCVDCHDPHTLEVQLDECVVCHTGLESTEDLLDVRMAGSLVDYDGDGDMSEGVYYEIEGMRDILYQMMQTYAAEVAGAGILYESATYPYFFIDTDGDGEVSAGEAVFPNQFNAWTPRLAKAAYNYQVSLKDPGRYAHGGKYIIQLLYDSIEDLNEGLGGTVEVSALRRIDHGHFAGSEEAFRHWDEDGFVPGTCSKCHTAAGLPLFLAENVTISQPPSNGFNCSTCHNDVSQFTIYEVTQVRFPSGAAVGFGERDLGSNLCLNCHQGRESTVSVNNTIGNLPDDEVSESLRFRNIHYFAAGASVFGTEVRGAYEYDGRTYLGRNEHVPGYDSCTECHNTHALEVEVQGCADCHVDIDTKEDLRNIRISEIDFDGNGDVTEGIAAEVEALRAQLYAELQVYAASNPDTAAIVYDSSAYPYFFIDTNENGVSDPGEAIFPNGYNTWTPRLLRAAYNYQYATKDTGAYAHNALYIIQILYDAIEDIGGDTSTLTRPSVPVE